MKNPVSKLLAGAAAATVLAGMAMAQDLTLADDSRLVRSITLEELEALVAVAGDEIISTGENGAVSVNAATPEGLNYRMIGTVCSEDGVPSCNGIHMVVTYAASDRVDDAVVNAASKRTFVTSVWQEDGQLGISRYLILDGGQTMENIKVNYENFLSAVDVIVQDIWPDYAGE
ncbi:hypothetical protein [Aquisalinus flavus]|uniref:YbjN domain-containing protein n=1 Tax=Aquisalinus flavus TaxID=1526572 RepID=A0A8J2Y4M1_9PROT|nr:hypothetical protein [Aquisalinus flavus]MBD0426947.1 hypothetical protein [Aquisalinus flavus]UNE46787.1 YbjN domain-containing protein [Aquisalinus flavus]GGC97166.1 hypothetical protein GCM10011342_02600 [Aquisalinus flavus]